MGPRGLCGRGGSCTEDKRGQEGFGETGARGSRIHCFNLAFSSSVKDSRQVFLRERVGWGPYDMFPGQWAVSGRGSVQEGEGRAQGKIASCTGTPVCVGGVDGRLSGVTRVIRSGSARGRAEGDVESLQ